MFLDLYLPSEDLLYVTGLAGINHAELVVQFNLSSKGVLEVNCCLLLTILELAFPYLPYPNHTHYNLEGEREREREREREKKKREREHRELYH